MKKLYFLLLATLPFFATAQDKNWLQNNDRERNYPSEKYITGFSIGNIRAGETKSEATVRLRKEAQAYVAEAVRVEVSSETQSHDTRLKLQNTGSEATEQIKSIFESAVKTSTTIELSGLETDSYYDEREGVVYGFAWVNKYELTTFYKISLNMTLQQLESVLNTAKQLEDNSEKAKARTQYEEAVLLLVKAEQAQDILVALDKNAATQHNKTANYRSDIIQALARLAQGVYIYVKESKENMFGENSPLIADNMIRSILCNNGCSFTTDDTQADFILTLDASVRKRDPVPGIPSTPFCDADVKVKLIKKQTQKTVYEGTISEKGGHNSFEYAAREAFKNVGEKIADELMKWVK